MSDRFDADALEAARKIAVRCKAIGLCSACGSTWSTDAFAPDDDDSMLELVAAARRVIDEDEALDRFDDDGGLKHALASVIADAAPERSCSHAH